MILLLLLTFTCLENMLACAKLKKALMELENLKREKEHDGLGILAVDSQNVSKTS